MRKLIINWSLVCRPLSLSLSISLPLSPSLSRSLALSRTFELNFSLVNLYNIFILFKHIQQQQHPNQQQQQSRRKRSLACNQVKSDKDACCLESFYVNFTEIGWDKWILYPSGYNANYCRGQCDISHARYYHSTLLSKFSHIIGLCCSPRQMAPLSLLYIDEDNKVHQKLMANMIVESCDCAWS